MCSGMNAKRIDAIRLEELKKKLAEAFKNDRTHTEALSK